MEQQTKTKEGKVSHYKKVQTILLHHSRQGQLDRNFIRSVSDLLIDLKEDLSSVGVEIEIGQVTHMEGF